MHIQRHNLLDRQSTVANGTAVEPNLTTGDYLCLVQYNGFDGTAKLQKSADNSSWTDVATFTGAGKNLVSMNFVIPDISTADEILVPIGFNGKILSLTTVIAGAITGADAVVTLDDSSDNEICTITVANSGSASGDVDTDAAAAAYDDVTAGSYLKLATDGASTNAVECVCTVLAETTAESGIEIYALGDLDFYVRGITTAVTRGEVSIDLVI